MFTPDMSIVMTAKVTALNPLASGPYRNFK
jgi:hypothetical protein